MPDAPLASVVIVCFGRRDMTERCLHSLDRALGPAFGTTVEVIAVDNASPDDTLTLLDAWSDRIRVVRLPENRNFAGGNNAGAQAARGEALIFLNNDTVVEAGVMEELARTVLEPGVGAAGPRLLYPDGTIQHAGVLFIRSKHGVPTPSHVHHLQDGALPASRGVHELDVVTGACLAVRRSVFLELDGFDEAYANGYEDVDLCLRLRVAGHTVVYRGDLAFVHDEGATRGQGINDISNQERFQQRWGAMLDDDAPFARATWGTGLSGVVPPQELPESTLVLFGQPRGVGSGADEIRALTHAAEVAGRPAVALDLILSLTPVDLDGPAGRATDTALRRRLPASGVGIDVPTGAAPVGKASPCLYVRLPGDAPARPGTVAIRATPCGDDLWVPPPVCVQSSPSGARHGVVVTLPTHDRLRTRQLLDELRALPGEDLRIVPTLDVRGLAEDVAAVVPHAQLLPPAAHDAAWERVAATAEIAICADPDDVYERRALVAAACGATPVTAVPDGPAGALVPDLLHLGEAGSVAQSIAAAHERAADRDAVAATVREACDPARIGETLLASVTAAVAA